MEGWIHGGWCHHEGELLLPLRERQNERLLLGHVHRVLENWESRIEKTVLGDTGRGQILKSGSFFEMCFPPQVVAKLLQDVFHSSLHV